MHAEAAARLRKPLVVSAFAKQRLSGQSTVATRNAFFRLVYQEAQRSEAVAGALGRV